MQITTKGDEGRYNPSGTAVIPRKPACAGFLVTAVERPTYAAQFVYAKRRKVGYDSDGSFPSHEILDKMMCSRN